MNENLNLVEILKNCPKGTKLYSTIYGDVKLEKISNYKNDKYPIFIRLTDNIIVCVTKDGRHIGNYAGECVLFPSKEKRDWSKFKPKQAKQFEREELCKSQEITKWAYISDPLPKKSKFDPRLFKPFDKVLVRFSNAPFNIWYADFVSEPTHIENVAPVTISTNNADMVIPYNEDTDYLVSTTEEAPEFYRYWED